MLHRSINGIFIILAAVLVLTAGSVVYAQKASDAAGGKSSDTGVGAGKIGIGNSAPVSPYARPTIGSADGGFARQEDRCQPLRFGLRYYHPAGLALLEAQS